MSKLKPRGFVLATGLLPLVSKTAAHVFEWLRLRSAPNRKMSLMQELLAEANISVALPTVFKVLLQSYKQDLTMKLKLHNGLRMNRMRSR